LGFGTRVYVGEVVAWHLDPLCSNDIDSSLAPVIFSLGGRERGRGRFEWRREDSIMLRLEGEEAGDWFDYADALDGGLGLTLHVVGDNPPNCNA
jgi:hypothetical protein